MSYNATRKEHRECQEGNLEVNGRLMERRTWRAQDNVHKTMPLRTYGQRTVQQSEALQHRRARHKRK